VEPAVFNLPVMLTELLSPYAVRKSLPAKCDRWRSLSKIKFSIFGSCQA
jgi:hypothetical protein